MSCIEDTKLKTRPTHAYIYGKRKDVAENTLSKERLEEIKEEVSKYFQVCK